MKTKIPIVDDEESALDLCLEMLKGMYFEIEVTDSGQKALTVLKREETDILLSDVRMPGMDGIEFLKIIRQNFPESDVVLMTGYGTVSTCVEAMKLGASDYITKPFHAEDFRHRLQTLAENRVTHVEHRLPREQLKRQQGFAGLLGTSVRMQ